VGDALLPCCPFSLGNSQFCEQFTLSLQTLIMIYAHYNKIAFTVCRQIDRLILFVAYRSDFSSSVSQARYRLDDRHIRLLIVTMHKLIPNYDIIKYSCGALRLTNGKPALARFIGEGETEVG
jgi:hypothetical protein